VGPRLLLLVAVAVVGVLHTVVPDHWLPISLLARQEGWTRRETGRAAAGAGIGHSLSTTYVVLCVTSTAAVERVHLGPLERYGEVLSGAFIAAVGLVFLVWVQW
jgi:hypothetical protein